MSKKTTDGRRLRSERSKKAILDATEQLFQEGLLVPTAQIISDKADVRIRSFFRHFPDMEALNTALSDNFQSKYREFFSHDVCVGTLDERIESAVKLHTEFYEEHASVFRSAKVQLWRYKDLNANYVELQDKLRDDFDMRIRELKELDSQNKEIIDGLISYEMWARLRDLQNLSVEKSSELIQKMIKLVLQDAL